MGGMKAVHAVLRMVDGQAADARVHDTGTSQHSTEEVPQELPETLDETLAMLERMAAGGDVQLDEVATMRRRLLAVSGAPPELPHMSFTNLR